MLSTGFTPTGPRDERVVVGALWNIRMSYATGPDRARKVVEVPILGTIRQQPPGVKAVGRCKAHGGTPRARNDTIGVGD